MVIVNTCIDDIPIPQIFNMDILNRLWSISDTVSFTQAKHVVLNGYNDNISLLSTILVVTQINVVSSRL